MRQLYDGRPRRPGYFAAVAGALPIAGASKGTLLVPKDGRGSAGASREKRNAARVMDITGRPRRARSKGPRQDVRSAARRQYRELAMTCRT